MTLVTFLILVILVLGSNYSSRFHHISSDIFPHVLFSFSTSCSQLLLLLMGFELSDSQCLFTIIFDEIKDEINMLFPLILFLKKCISISRLFIYPFNTVTTMELKLCVVGVYCLFDSCKTFCFKCFNKYSSIFSYVRIIMYRHGLSSFRNMFLKRKLSDFYELKKAVFSLVFANNSKTSSKGEKLWTHFFKCY